MVMHAFVLFETQSSATMLNTFEMLHVAKVVPFVCHCEKMKFLPFRYLFNMVLTVFHEFVCQV